MCSDFYEPGAIMLDEEAHVISGLLVGLNVIDCNIGVKDEDLDRPVILRNYMFILCHKLFWFFWVYICTMLFLLAVCFFPQFLQPKIMFLQPHSEISI